MVCKIKAFPEDRSLVAPVVNDMMKEARVLFSLKVDKKILFIYIIYIYREIISYFYEVVTPMFISLHLEYI
jgi:hypothetical protein